VSAPVARKRFRFLSLFPAYDIIPMCPSLHFFLSVLFSLSADVCGFLTVFRLRWSCAIVGPGCVGYFSSTGVPFP